MERIQLWRPDTCGCRIHQAVDDAAGTIRMVTEAEAEVINEARRRHPEFSGATRRDPVTPAKTCDAHSELGHTTARFHAVLGENVAKNRAHAELLKIARLTRTRIDDETGAELVELKPGVRHAWSFTGTGDRRQLHVTVEGAVLTGPERAAIAAKVPFDVQVT